MSKRIQAGNTARLRTHFLSGCAGAAICGAVLAGGTLAATASTLQNGALAPDAAPIASDRMVVADLDDAISSFVDQVVQVFTDDPDDDADDDDADDGDDQDDGDDLDDEDEGDDNDDGDDDDDRDDGDDSDDGDDDSGGDDSDD